jgi:hypothetical protein
MTTSCNRTHMDVCTRVVMVLAVGILATALSAAENGEAPPDLNAMQERIQADLQRGDANPAEALPHYRSAYDLAGKMARLDAGRSGAVIDTVNRLGELWLKLGDTSKALGSFKGALQSREQRLCL